MKNNSKKHINVYSFLCVILIIYMIAINNITNSILSLLAIALSAVFIFKPVYILPPLFIASLMGEYFVAFKGFGMARIMVLIYIFGSLIRLVSNKEKIKFRYVILAIIAIAFNIISGVTSITGSITPAMTMSLNIVMIFCLAYNQEDELDSFLKTMTVSNLILSIYILYTVISGNAYSLSNRFAVDQAVNANIMGMALAQLSAYFFGVLLLSENKKFKIGYLFIIIINTVELLLTGSRSATLGLVVSIFIVIFIRMLRADKIGKKMSTFIFVIILIVGSYIGLTKFGAGVIQRFTVDSVLESGGTGRTIIWSALINYVIPNNLFFGVGLGGENVYIAVSPYVPTAHGTHNILLTIIAQVGIIGGVAYIAFFVKSTKNIIKNYMKIDYLVVPLAMILTAFVNGIGEDVFDERYLWFALGLGFMFIYNKKLADNEENI